MKKRVFAAVLLVLLFGACAALAASYEVYSKASVYEDPSSGADKIGVVYAGDTVEVIDYGSTWCEIEMGVAGHATGYIKTKHLKDSSSRKTTSYYVKDNSANVYEYTSSSAPVDSTLRKGDQVHVYSIDNGWAQIVWGSGHAYVKSKHLSRSKPGSGGGGGSDTPESTGFDIGTGYGTMTDVYYRAYVTPNAGSSYVNLRWGPSKETPIKGVRYSGDVLQVIAQNSGWCQVLDTRTGELSFMMRHFLTPMN